MTTGAEVRARGAALASDRTQREQGLPTVERHRLVLQRFSLLLGEVGPISVQRQRVEAKSARLTAAVSWRRAERHTKSWPQPSGAPNHIYAFRVEPVASP